MFLKSRSRSQLCNIQPFNFLVSGVILLFIINAQEANAAVGDACNAITEPCPGFAEICDTDICVCRYPFYQNGTTCAQRIYYGDTCTDGGPQDQCFSNLTCIAGNSTSTCGCTDDYQYVPRGNFCKKKNAYGERCSFVGGFDNLCLVGTCNGTQCVCGTNEYYDPGKDQCISNNTTTDISK